MLQLRRARTDARPTPRARYGERVSALRACPFCRTLYRSDEGAVCLDCGVALVPMHTLGLSEDAASEDARLAVLPEDEPLPWNAFARGRGALLLLSLLGLALFFTPWVEVLKPESVVRSGYELARGRAGWLWGGASAYLVLLPLVWTRRTIARMRGVRVVVVLFASMTLFEVLMLALLPPRSRGLVPVALEWRWGLFASGFTSLLATLVGARFGGSLPPLPNAEPNVPARPVRSTGETLH
jgi:hypothetical protein